MDGGSDQLFSRTGLPKNEDRCVRRSNLFRPIENILEPVTLPDNIDEVALQLGLLTEVNILGLELVFHCLDFRKSRPKFDRPLLYLLFEIVMGFLQRLLYLLARGDVRSRRCGRAGHRPRNVSFDGTTSRRNALPAQLTWAPPSRRVRNTDSQSASHGCPSPR